MPVEADAAENDGGEEEEEEADGDSSGESGSDSGEEGNGSSSGDEPSTPPPPIELPDRSTRGKRLRAFVQKIADEEEDADNDFWKQDFFAEEGVDGEYSADSNSEDSGDSDFSDPEEEDKEDDGTEEALRSVLKLKKSKEKPPGHKQAALRKAAQARAKKQREAKAAGETEQPGPAKKEAKKVRFSEPAEPASAPSLRRSTKVRTAATISAEKQRAVSDAQRRPAARTKPKEAQAALRMVDVLQRAAADQLANQASLQALIAREADLKAKANQKASAARGPRVRWRYYTDFVPDPGGTLPEDSAASDAGGASTSAREPSGSCDKEQNGDGERCTRVGRCTLAFVEMTPDTVPPQYRRQALNSVLRPPKDMCVKADGTMQQRVRRLTPQEKAQTAAKAPALGGAGGAGVPWQGSVVASSVEDRMLGAVRGAITGKLRQQYGEMSRVVESVDGYQGMQATAAQHIESMCAPDPMRGLHGSATACIGMQGQGGAQAGAMDVDMTINGAFPGTSIGGMNNLGGTVDARWQSGSGAGQGPHGAWVSGKGKVAKLGKGKGRKEAGRTTTLHAVVAAAAQQQAGAASGHPASVAGLSQGMYAGHAHAPMHGSQGSMHMGQAAAGVQCGSVGSAGVQAQHGHHDGADVPKAASGFAGMYWKLDASMGSAALGSDRLVGTGGRNGHHAPLGDLNAGAGLPLDGATAHPGQLPRNGCHPPNGSTY